MSVLEGLLVAQYKRFPGAGLTSALQSIMSGGLFQVVFPVPSEPCVLGASALLFLPMVVSSIGAKIMHASVCPCIMLVHHSKGLFLVQWPLWPVTAMCHDKAAAMGRSCFLQIIMMPQMPRVGWRQELPL